MNKRQVECILDLRKTLNFSNTADNLYLSQSTISYAIKSAEEEIGFNIFFRNGKSVSMTPAGIQFCIALENLHKQYQTTINQCQNLSRKYDMDISISIPFRSSIYYLSDAIAIFKQKHPNISITALFNPGNCLEKFLMNEGDICFTSKDSIKRISNIKIYSLFKSHFYLVSRKDDPLASKSLITAKDLEGRTLMIGGPSPKQLLNIQQSIIKNYEVDYFNSTSHDTTLLNVAANNGVCISPGLLNDHNHEFAWTKYDSDEYIEYVLCIHENNTNPYIEAFVQLLCEMYKAHPELKI
ncbi:MAG TPA: LysR family transcriptional regulator [Candidatus Fimiplasma intestinipullorum]|uniref:LysR family transcriptional regulator n=1 Tax=Candidatus Fimiplasma intestinipullorum TaxID=2840825 RepID=A0A9D1KZD6_9FIRM|nr:LysR family transcriptional regulator [Candidatus Fimiplasma intestinipullorum]